MKISNRNLLIKMKALKVYSHLYRAHKKVSLLTSGDFKELLQWFEENRFIS
jgi:hypothetical protein